MGCGIHNRCLGLREDQAILDALTSTKTQQEAQLMFLWTIQSGRIHQQHCSPTSPSTDVTSISCFLCLVAQESTWTWPPSLTPTNNPRL